MSKLNNIERRQLKLFIKNLVEKHSNNIVVKIKITDNHHAECLCENKLSDGQNHTIEVLFAKRIAFLIYDDCMFSQILL